MNDKERVQLEKEVFKPLFSQLSDKYNCPKCDAKPINYFADVHSFEESAICPNCGFEYIITNKNKDYTVKVTMYKNPYYCGRVNNKIGKGSK